MASAARVSPSPEPSSDAWARHVLAALGGEPRAPARTDPEPAARSWARSGAMALTGPAEGPPAAVRAPLASAAAGAALALGTLAESDAVLALDGAALLGERAAALGLARRGRTSPGGSCRLLRAADGFVAVGLARDDDVRALPAWLDPQARGEPSDPFGFVAERIRDRPVARVVERGRLLGLPVAPVPRRPVAPGALVRVVRLGRPRAPDPSRPPLVVDLSALWAGPLCAHLLAIAGARVVKVESSARPDGARRGPAAFFDLLHAGKASVALDLRTSAGRGRLAALVDAADVVVESARPRALAQLGIDAEAVVAGRPGLVWVSITGYGRRGAAGGWVAFGDDAACAAGLAWSPHAPEAPVFCGDAVADPLAGLHAAAAAWASRRRGGGELLDVSLTGVAAHVAAAAPVEAPDVFATDGGFAVRTADGGRIAVAPPRARAPAGAARPLGADTDAVLAELAPESSDGGRPGC